MPNFAVVFSAFGVCMVLAGMEIGGSIVIASSIITFIFMGRRKADPWAEMPIPDDMDEQIAREEEGDLKVIMWEYEQWKRRSA